MAMGSVGGVLSPGPLAASPDVRVARAAVPVVVCASAANLKPSLPAPRMVCVHNRCVYIRLPWRYSAL